MDYYASREGVSAIALSRISARIAGRVPSGYDWFELQGAARELFLRAERATPARCPVTLAEVHADAMANIGNHE